MQLTKTQHIFVCTLMLCMVSFLMFPLMTFAQTVSIPDANLREAINEALGKAPNARITANEMQRLTRFDANK